MTAQQALRPDLMLAYLVWIGIVGYLLNAGLVVAQRHLFGRAALVQARHEPLGAVLARGQPRGCGRLHRVVAGDRQPAAGIAGLSAGTGPRLGSAGPRLCRRRPLGQAVGTLEHMAYGWFIASIAGIALGALIGSSRTMRSYVAPSLEFLRPLPVSAIIPVAIAMLGPDAGHGAVRDRVRRDLADAAGDDPRLRGGRAAALRSGAVAAHVAVGSDLQRSRCPRPAPISSPACASA
jgi:hypothetical protein